jgi:hypothetical protein
MKRDPAIRALKALGIMLRIAERGVPLAALTGC